MVNGQRVKIKGFTQSPVTIIATNLVEDIWPEVEPLLLKGIGFWGDYYDIDDLKTACIKGKMQLWVALEEREIHMVMLTMLVIYPKRKLLRYFYIGGKRLKDVMYYNPNVVKWAREHGASGDELIGRDGWIRALRRLGFEYRASYLVRPWNTEN